MTDNLDDSTDEDMSVPSLTKEYVKELAEKYGYDAVFVSTADDQYAEAMELFGGKPIPKIGNPTEYVGLIEANQKAMIEKYGHIPELNNMVAVDEQPDD